MNLKQNLLTVALLFVLAVVLVIPAQSFADDSPVVKKGTLFLEDVPDPECHCPGGIGDCICKIPRKMLPKD